MNDADQAYRYPQALVSSDWLQAHLDDPKLRVFDCTCHLLPAGPEDDAPYRTQSGRADYQQGHIPGAGFLDLTDELSDQSSSLRFMLPPAAQFTAAMSRNGVGPGTQVVLYSDDGIRWATRVWWLLRAFGFDDAAILDGGKAAWVAEQRPLSTEPCRYPPAEFVAQPRPQLMVDQQQMLAALQAPNTMTLNALGRDLHCGSGPSRYGRPGRIPGSVNVPAAELIAADQRFVPWATADAAFRDVGMSREQTVITYCGGGIAATVDLFVLHQLGYQDLKLYDASLSEWAKDQSLPIETD